MCSKGRRTVRIKAWSYKIFHDISRQVGETIPVLFQNLDPSNHDAFHREENYDQIT
jgi:hypothetical protein